MNSWWELGEASGYAGGKMEMWRITCAFCSEKGNFSLAHHEEKRKSNSTKKLNFDLYQCRNCMAFVHVLWSASEFTGSIYSYRVLPGAIGKPEPSQNWPEPVQRYWIQAKDSLQSENWDAAALMARSALQLVMRDKGANGGTLKAEIKDLVEKKILLPTMEDWSTEVRELGNESAHPSAKAAPTEPQDARDVGQFLDYLLLYLYDLPKQIADYRSRKAKQKSDPGKI